MVIVDQLPFEKPVTTRLPHFAPRVAKLQPCFLFSINTKKMLITLDPRLTPSQH